MRTLEDEVLYPDDIEDEKLVQFKCQACNCIVPMFQDLPGYERVMENGYGLGVSHRCINRVCGCHTGNYPRPKILRREVTLAEAFGTWQK